MSESRVLDWKTGCVGEALCLNICKDPGADNTRAQLGTVPSELLVRLK